MNILAPEFILVMLVQYRVNEMKTSIFLKNNLSFLFGKQPNGAIFVERERERVKSSIIADTLGVTSLCAPTLINFTKVVLLFLCNRTLFVSSQFNLLVKHFNHLKLRLWKNNKSKNKIGKCDAFSSTKSANKLYFNNLFF